jgi:hypothetical protein
LLNIYKKQNKNEQTDKLNGEQLYDNFKALIGEASSNEN